MVFIQLKLGSIKFVVVTILLFDTSVLAQRTINNETFLAKFVGNNLNDYWFNLTLILENHFKENSLIIFENWKQAIRRYDLQNKINPKCLNIIEYIIRNPLDQEWTAKMIDSGILRLPSGLMSGTTTYLGDFDQCISIHNQFNHNEFVGKYCLATLNIPRLDQFRHPIPLNSNRLNHSWLGDYIEKWYQNDNFYSIASSICFPSVCNQYEIQQMLLSYYNFLNLFEFNVTYCQSSLEPREHRFGLIIALAILIMPWFLIIPATIMEYWLGDSCHATLYQLLSCFSLIKNNRHLFQLQIRNGTAKQEFQFIHGIRAIGALFIMCAHAGALIFVPMFMPVSVLARHPTDSIAISKTLIAQPFYNGALVVMTFFVISGFLSTYLNASNQKLKIGFIPYVLLRWLRLTPSLIGTICLNISLELMGNGPLFHHDILWPTLRPCYQNWWIHVLYISNFFGFEEMCNIQTWYLSADLQVHIIAYLILFLYTRNKRLAKIMCMVFVSIGLIGVVTPVFANWIKLVLIQTIVYTKFPTRGDVGQFIYFAVFLQLIPYFLGCLVGLTILDKRTIKFSKLQEILLWAGSILIFIGLPFSSYPFAGDESKIEGDGTIVNAISFALMILLWSLANSWIVYQCSIKPKITLTRILSANIFKPLSRLSFSLYLGHLMTIWFNAHQTRSPISFANWIELYKVLSTTIISGFIIGYWLHVTFEAPIIGLIIFFCKNLKTRKAATISSDPTDHLNADINNNSSDETIGNGESIHSDIITSLSRENPKMIKSFVNNESHKMKSIRINTD